MKSIVVASDLSDRSDEAVRRGAALARGLGARLTVLHVVDSALPAEIAKVMQDQAERHMQDTLAGCTGGDELTAEVRTEIGDVAETLNQAAQEVAADLLVVGAHRRRAFLDQFRETTMERLIRCSRVPVLMVTGPGELAYTHILGAVALSRNCANALLKGCSIAPNARISLFHAHDASFRKESVRDYATWMAVSTLPPDLPDPMFIEGTPQDAVTDLMADGDYDLMTIGANTRSGMSQLLLGGSTAAWIRSAPCDLLVAK